MGPKLHQNTQQLTTATQQKTKTKNNQHQTHQFRKADHNGSIAVGRDGHSIGAADFLTQGFTQHAVQHGGGGHLGDLHGTITCTTKQTEVRFIRHISRQEYILQSDQKKKKGWRRKTENACSINKKK